MLAAFPWLSGMPLVLRQCSSTQILNVEALFPDLDGPALVFIFSTWEAFPNPSWPREPVAGQFAVFSEASDRIQSGPIPVFLNWQQLLSGHLDTIVAVVKYQTSCRCRSKLQ